MSKGTLSKWLENPAPIGRIGQPSTQTDHSVSLVCSRLTFCSILGELGPAYVFLASADGSFISGQTIHVNGGAIVAG